MVHCGGRSAAQRLEHWDPFTLTTVRRTVSVDADLCRTSCALAADAVLGVVVSWHASSTRLSHSPPVTVLGALGGRLRADLELQIPGTDIGGTVDLRTRMVLLDTGSTSSPVAPRVPGAVLWADNVKVAVEGGAGRFPVSAVDFAATEFSDDAASALEWNSEDLASPVLGSLRLLVNSSHEGLLEALRSGTDGPRSAAARSMIMFDVARSLIRGALRSELYCSDPSGYEEDSVGRMITDLIASVWPGVTTSTIAGWAEDSPARFDTALQAHLGVLR